MPKLPSVAGATQRERDFEVVPKTVGDKAMAMEPLGQTWTFSSATQLGTRMAHSKIVPQVYTVYAFNGFFQWVTLSMIYFTFCCNEKLNSKINMHFMTCVNLTLYESHQEVILVS